ncbi:hypothetical protein [Stieleria varia]|uniref:Uncharacterized protein n=1 Tax=Stieleria varia TaxID=2528005 RepID=A0A5C6AJG5_9BACT|nr:hypothetical protein [Stieleria varia]TWT98343.1 hypothetical protein Pla52n_48550 [Stieleria varia]
MTPIVKLISLVSLAAVMLPCLGYFLGLVGLDAVKWTALAGTIVWFIATPMWMSRDLPVDAGEVEI